MMTDVVKTEDVIKIKVSELSQKEDDKEIKAVELSQKDDIEIRAEESFQEDNDKEIKVDESFQEDDHKEIKPEESSQKDDDKEIKAVELSQKVDIEIKAEESFQEDNDKEIKVEESFQEDDIKEIKPEESSQKDDIEMKAEELYQKHNIKEIKNGCEIVNIYDSTKIELDANKDGVKGRIEFIKNFLAESEATELYKDLVKDLHWQQKDSLNITGEKYPEPRLTFWYGKPYKYSKISWPENEDWHPKLQDLKKALSNSFPDPKRPFNSVMCNYYRDNKDSIGWHADDETSLGRCPKIGSISLGHTRVFEVCKREEYYSRFGKEPSIDKSLFAGCTMMYRFHLGNGSLLLMEGSVQDNWLHRVPKENDIMNGRINLTFRHIVERDEENEEIAYKKKLHKSRVISQPNIHSSESNNNYRNEYKKRYNQSYNFNYNNNKEFYHYSKNYNYRQNEPGKWDDYNGYQRYPNQNRIRTISDGSRSQYSSRNYSTRSISSEKNVEKRRNNNEMSNDNNNYQSYISKSNKSNNSGDSLPNKKPLYSEKLQNKNEPFEKKPFTGNSGNSSSNFESTNQGSQNTKQFSDYKESTNKKDDGKDMDSICEKDFHRFKNNYTN